MKLKDLETQPMVGKIKAATISFSVLSLLWLLMLFVLSLFEIVYNGIIHEFPPNIAGILFWSFLADIVFLLTYFFIIYLVYSAVFVFRPGLAKILYKIFIALLIVIQISLILYFSKALLPLGSDLYGYSITDIKQTIGLQAA